MFGDKFEKEFSKYNLCGNVLTISREKCGWTADTALKLRIAADTSPWIEEPDGAHTLGKDYIVPKEFGWLIPKMPADGAKVALTTDTKGGFKI
ncbi:MAG: hypothetical protein IJB70_05625 [Clostridia bacterium]|nr:hypothetical protein [Clostridia bacterium]